MTRKDWLPVEVEIVKKMYANGDTSVEISKELDRGVKSIRGQIAVMRARGQLPAHRPNKTGFFWDHEREVKLRNMWRLGETSSTISKALGCSRNAVLGKISTLGLLRKSGAPRRPGPKPVQLSRDEIIAQRYREGRKVSAIAKAVYMPTEYVRQKLKEMGFDLAESRNGIPDQYNHVHPMWSMNEDDRRAAFYEKFSRGWADVQRRLAR